MSLVDRSLNYNKVFGYFNNIKNFHLRHTCTNIILDEKMVKDPACNLFIDTCYKPTDYIIFSNEILHNYLLNKIPEDHFIYSTTMGIKDIKQINLYSKNNLIVLDYTKNNDNEYLQQLQFPKNIEILCGELCVDNCPYRMQHYIAVSKTNAHIPLDEGESDSCFFRDKLENRPPMLEWYLNSFQHAINNERIEELADLGIQNFKIAGRTRCTDAFFIFIIYYLILPEYREIAHKELLIDTQKMRLKYRVLSQV